MKEQKKILLCPLDWGLGHATRCIPILEELLKRDCEVFVASSGPALLLLKEDFPSLTYIEIPGYEPHYFSSRWQALAMLMQLRKFRRVIRAEHEEVAILIRKHTIDAVISDNRYGCWSDLVPSVFITHQLTIQTPFLQKFVNAYSHKLIRKFSACWVPDVPGKSSLAGDLGTGLISQPIGYLSRFRKLTSVKSEYEIVAIVSGPEPQRSIFEKIIRQQLRRSQKRSIMIKGLPPADNKIEPGVPAETNHLSAREMNEVIAGASVVISRPGYSTVMDLAKLGKRAIFVPTPGQTEQEYLGARLMQSKIAFAVKQDEFDLQDALRKVAEFKGFKPFPENTLLAEALDKLLK